MGLERGDDDFPEGFDGEALERGHELMGRIVPSMEGVRLIVTPDFEQEIRRHLADEEKALAYRQDRGDLGAAMARTMPGEDGRVDVIVDYRVFAVGNEPGLAERTIEHEAYHVAIHQRGECLDFPGREGWSGGAADSLLRAAEIACEEFRVELPICRHDPSAHYSDSPSFAKALDGRIRSLSRTYQASATEPDAVGAISTGIGEQFGSLVTASGYVAATMEGADRGLPEFDPGVAARLLGVSGPLVIELLRKLPGADVEADPGELEAAARELATALGVWLEEIGFRWREVGDVLHFDVLEPDKWLRSSG